MPDYTIDDLLYLMARLRDPQIGCPWDLKQTFQSIAPHTLEEVYEVIDAIEQQDYEGLKGELGDLLFQTIFYSRLAQEQGLFDFNCIVSALVAKLIARHPHVFPKGTLDSSRAPHDDPDELQIGKTWERIKKSERNEKGATGVFDNIPRSLPALVRVAKLQKRAAQYGFDWPSHEGVFSKINEEIAELRQAVASADQQQIEEELGDLLFTVINLSRHLKVDSETALRKAARKFEQRFIAMEALAREQGEVFETLSNEQLEQLWIAVKQVQAPED